MPKKSYNNEKKLSKTTQALSEMKTNGRKSALVARNVVVNGHRTTIKLEPAMWYALMEIAEREQMTINDVCSNIAHQSALNSSFIALVRIFILEYYREAATEIGHKQSGHGSGQINFKVSVGAEKFRFVRTDYAAVNSFHDSH